jgi:predicted nucleotidyltransferase component of viral defense system
MSQLPDKQQCEQAAAELAVDAAMVEKDWHVAQVLAFLSQHSFSGYHIIFSGGTSLSKAHGLIQRFSEDIDFKVTTDEASPDRETLSQFKHAVVDALKKAGFAVTQSSLAARDNNRFFSFHIEYDSQFAPLAGLRPHIQLEFTVSPPALPSIKRPVASFLTQLKKEEPEVTEIDCVDPVEIAADKLSALVWRIPKQAQTPEKMADRSLVRHMHDLAALETLAREHPRFSALVHAALARDAARNKETASLSHKEKFNALLDALSDGDERYRAEYDTFVASVSYASDDAVAGYDAALAAVKQLMAVAVPA